MSKSNGHKQEGPEVRVPQGPVPTQFFTSVVTVADGSSWCLFTAATPLGLTTYWLPVGMPGELSAMLAKSEAELRSTGPGIIVPSVDVRKVIEAVEAEKNGGN